MVEDGVLTIAKRFYRPIKVNISDSLFQIKTKNGKAHSFYFDVDGKYIHISPAHYTKGNKLSERIMAYLKNQNVSISAI